MKFSIKDFFSKCDQIRIFRSILSIYASKKFHNFQYKNFQKGF